MAQKPGFPDFQRSVSVIEKPKLYSLDFLIIVFSQDLLLIISHWGSTRKGDKMSYCQTRVNTDGPSYSPRSHRAGGLHLHPA